MVHLELENLDQLIDGPYALSTCFWAWGGVPNSPQRPLISKVFLLDHDWGIHRFPERRFSNSILLRVMFWDFHSKGGHNT